jgi:hypothetical protein
VRETVDNRVVGIVHDIDDDAELVNAPIGRVPHKGLPIMMNGHGADIDLSVVVQRAIVADRVGVGGKAVIDVGKFLLRRASAAGFPKRNLQVGMRIAPRELGDVDPGARGVDVAAIIDVLDIYAGCRDGRIRQRNKPADQRKVGDRPVSLVLAASPIREMLRIDADRRLRARGGLAGVDRVAIVFDDFAILAGVIVLDAEIVAGE